MLRALVGAGAKLEATDEVGRTALIAAAHDGKRDCVEFLLGAGADVHAADKAGDTALHRAAENGQLECTRLLVGAGADVAKRNKEGETALEARRSRRAQGDVVDFLAPMDEDFTFLS